MDHFNATVHNGALVSTRKGLLISKSKHQGMRFVNAFASDPNATQAPSTGTGAGSGAGSGSSSAPAAPATSSSAPAPAPAATAQASSKTSNEHNDTTIHTSGGTGEESAEAGGQKNASKWFDSGVGMTTPSPAVTATTPASMISSTNNNTNSSSSRRIVEEPFTPMSNEDVGGLADDSHDQQVARALLYTSDQQSANLADPAASNSIAVALPTTQNLHMTVPGPSTAGEASEVDNPSRYLESVPAMTQRVVSQYLNNVPQETHLYEAIAVIASLTTGVGPSGNISPTELATSIARVCATMNKDFLTGDDGGRAKRTVVLESVAAMAIDGMFSGQPRHWHVLMKTVRDIVDRSGGMKMEWGSTLNKIRKADIKGAVYAGTTPYLQFTKLFPSILEALPAQTRAEMTSNLQRCLQPCSILAVNITSLQTLAFFAQTVILARRALTAGSHVAIDPQGYAEDCLHVGYQLIKYPRDLRSDVAEADQALAGLPVSNTNTQTDASSSSSSSSSNKPNLLNPLVRVAGLLYIEDLLPDVRSVDLYNILLTVLTHLVQNIILAIRHRGIDPQLHPAASGSSRVMSDTLPNPESSRPVILWACMIGHAITNYVLQARPSSLVNRAPFEDCVALLLAESNGLRNGDMDLCEVLPVRELRAVGCDESTLLRQIVAAYEAKKVWNTAP